MLSYAFKVLRDNGYKSMATEEFNNMAEMMAQILLRGISLRLKRGLEKEYLSQTQALSFLRGKIDISDSIKTQSIRKRQLVCIYDDFSINNRMNQIIKSTLEILLKADIGKNRKKEIRKLMVFFSDVDSIDLYSADWNLRYNRNNQTYQMLIGICYLVVKGLMQTNSDGVTKLMDYLDEQHMWSLYQNFIFQYYKKHYPGLKVSSSQIPWFLDDDKKEMLPVMQSDIYIQRDNTVLIIDAKYYKNITQIQFGKHKFHSAHLYQMFAYVKNCEYHFADEKNSVSGMLLYAKTDGFIEQNHVYQMHGNKISINSLDLSLPFEQIAMQMDEIIKTHFPGVEKH
jgi:hypothetical protein